MKLSSPTDATAVQNKYQWTHAQTFKKQNDYIYIYFPIYNLENWDLIPQQYNIPIRLALFFCSHVWYRYRKDLQHFFSSSWPCQQAFQYHLHKAEASQLRVDVHQWGIWHLLFVYRAQYDFWTDRIDVDIRGQQFSMRSPVSEATGALPWIPYGFSHPCTWLSTSKGVGTPMGPPPIIDFKTTTQRCFEMKWRLLVNARIFLAGINVTLSFFGCDWFLWMTTTASTTIFGASGVVLPTPWLPWLWLQQVSLNHT